MKYYFPFFFLLILASCSQPRYVYNPPARNLHYFTGKGQAVLSASWSTGPSRNDGGTGKNFNHGGDLQAAYAVSDHWGFSAAFHQRKEHDNFSVMTPTGNFFSDVVYHRDGWEIGSSYFVPLDQRRISFFYVDGGGGSSDNKLDDNSFVDSLYVNRYFKNQSARVFLQPGIYTGNNSIRFNLGLRFQYSGFSRQETSYTPLELKQYSLAGLNDILTFEPYMGFRFGAANFPWIRADIQMGIATINKGFFIRNSYFMFGLSFYPLARK
jgi:hypothetical protein